MKLGAFITSLLLVGGCHAQPLYHVCIGSMSTGQVECSKPLSRDAAAHRQALWSIVGAGTMMVWTERVHPTKHDSVQPLVIQVDPDDNVPPADRHQSEKGGVI